MCGMLQDFAAALQHPDLALCRKDVNALLGEMDPDAATLDYQSIAPEVYELLSARMVVSFCCCMCLMHHQGLCCELLFARVVMSSCFCICLCLLCIIRTVLQGFKA